MKQFYSPRSRIFHKRRGRIRQAVLPALLIASVYTALTFFNSEESVVSLPDNVAAINTPNALALTEPAVNSSLKEAFSAAPAPADYSVSSFAREEQSAPKPPATLAAANGQALAQKVAALQSGINALLETGENLLVSQKKVEVGKGDTLMGLLVENNVPREEAHQAIAALSKVYDPRGLNPGHEITVFFHKDPTLTDRRFSGISLEKDLVNTVIVNRDEDGRYSVDQQEKQVHRNMRGFSGKIDSSLYVSAKAQGVPDNVILDMIKMYSMNVDFQRDIQSGDGFEVMYEEYVTEDGKNIPGRGNILYAQMALGDRIMPFYRYEDKSGDVDYYDEKGQSAKKVLMKTPIDGARLSSGFGMRRHPVLGYSKMHKGVDFAAPRGTPIYAAGDGVIEKMGPFSSFGNYVRIRHRGDLKTAYAHLNGFKSGLRAGSRVKQGQVIGYVGTTGRSTGPHLHYEVMNSGKQVNPSSLKMATGKALKGKELEEFQRFMKKDKQQFAALLEKSAETAVARADAPAAANIARN